MADLDLLRMSDIDLQLANPDTQLRDIGFSGLGDVERFLESWGLVVADRPKGSQPKAVLFVLSPSDSPVDLPCPSSSDIGVLLDTLSELHTKFQICTVRPDGNPAGRHTIPLSTRRQIPGGLWTPDQASLISKGGLKDKCVCLASGRSIWVFVNGTIVLHYTDVKNRTIESGSEILRRQGWEDGAIIERCGREDLCDRSRLGIWHIPDCFVLKSKPEDLIQLKLESFLEKFLTGFEELIRERHVSSEGRVDLFVRLADGTTYFVEVKWVGRSIKKEFKSLAVVDKDLLTSLKKHGHVIL